MLRQSAVRLAEEQPDVSHEATLQHMAMDFEQASLSRNRRDKTNSNFGIFIKMFTVTNVVLGYTGVCTHLLAPRLHTTSSGVYCWKETSNRHYSPRQKVEGQKHQPQHGRARSGTQHYSLDHT